MDIPGSLKDSEFVVEALVSLSQSKPNGCYLVADYVGGGAGVIESQSSEDRQLVLRGYYDKGNSNASPTSPDFRVSCLDSAKVIASSSTVSAQLVGELSGIFPVNP